MYPVMLEVRDRRCLVVGGGGIALRKVQGLVEEGARVTVVALEVVPPLKSMADSKKIKLELRPYRIGETNGYSLVFAATDDRQINAQVFADAESAGIWANVADDPELCSFHLPARVRRGPLQLAIGSAGEAPFVVRRLRQILERRFGPEWGEWLEAAARYRRQVRSLGNELATQEAQYDRFFFASVNPETLTARVPTAGEEAEWLETKVDHLGDGGERPVLQDIERSGGVGCVSLVGAGPGCPGLLTVRGRQRLFTADAVVFDRLASAALPTELKSEVELHPVGKVAGHHPVPQEEINALLVRLARAGKRVVRLKGGDPYVFGRGGEEAEVLAAEGIRFEVIPGVTSGVAAMAWAGVPVTHRREAVRLNLLTAHEAIKDDGPQVRWDLLAADPYATIVGYMGVTALPQVVARLLEGGMDPETPAIMVEQGTTSAQKSVRASLSELPSAVKESELQPPALFAIGPTIRHADALDWFSRLPLAGRRILVPAFHSHLAKFFEEDGAEVVILPLPVTPAARVVMGALPLTDCIVHSPAEVDWLDEEKGSQGWEDTVAAWCVGEETASRARERGWTEIHELSKGLEHAEFVARISG